MYSFGVLVCSVSNLSLIGPWQETGMIKHTIIKRGKVATEAGAWPSARPVNGMHQFRHSNGHLT